MYLTRSIQSQRYFGGMVNNFARMGFATREYDVAVIGGGPGGKCTTATI